VRHDPTWLRTVGSVVGTLMALVGAAGIPDDIGTWGSWLRWARAEVPWWLLLSGGSAVLLMTWGPPLVRTRALQSLTERLLLASPLGATKRSRRETLRLHLVNLAFPASQHAMSLLRNFCHELARDGPPLHEWLGGLVQGHVFDGYERQASLMLDPFRSSGDGRNRSHYSDKEIADLFADYWYRYQGLATALHYAARIRPDLVLTSHLYPLWTKADGEFLEAIRRLTIQPGFDGIAAAVKRTGWGEGVRRISQHGAA